MITGAQLRAARAMVRWTPQQLADRAKLAAETIRRAERAEGEITVAIAHEQAIKSAFQSAGVEFTNGGGPGVRLIHSGQAEEGISPAQLTSENDG